MAVSETPRSAHVQCVSRATLLLCLILGSLLGRVWAWEPFFFFCACRMPRGFIPFLVLLGLFVFPAASIGILVVGLKPVWDLCNEISCVFDSRGLDAVKERTDKQKKLHNNVTYVF